ncbi:hypothetical protein DL95DRAFT_486564 [Leptodontidium sp. 2 PMI_412]|nr:hypothetical protein DL95DRAFT_486564 [Leptodontidium sp. 2 PMI_412]
MRLLVLAVLAFVGCISTALAAAGPEQEFPNESAPFNLVLLSANTILNGTRLYACHQVILQTSLCTVSCHKMPPAYPRPEHGTVFYLNYTEVEQEPHSRYRPITPDLGVEGILTRHYFAYHSDYKPSSMRFVDSTGMSLFNWGQDGAALIGFDKEEKLCRWGWNRDDPAVPPLPFYQWYVCITRSFNTWETLVWLSGELPENGGELRNPTCQKVDVKRVFI